MKKLLLFLLIVPLLYAQKKSDYEIYLDFKMELKKVNVNIKEYLNQKTKADKDISSFVTDIYKTIVSYSYNSDTIALSSIRPKMSEFFSKFNTNRNNLKKWILPKITNFLNYWSDTSKTKLVQKVGREDESGFNIEEKLEDVSEYYIIIDQENTDIYNRMEELLYDMIGNKVELACLSDSLYHYENKFTDAMALLDGDKKKSANIIGALIKENEYRKKLIIKMVELFAKSHNVSKDTAFSEILNVITKNNNEIPQSTSEVYIILSKLYDDYSTLARCYQMPSSPIELNDLVIAHMDIRNRFDTLYSMFPKAKMMTSEESQRLQYKFYIFTADLKVAVESNILDLFKRYGFTAVVDTTNRWFINSARSIAEGENSTSFWSEVKERWMPLLVSTNLIIESDKSMIDGRSNVQSSIKWYWWVLFFAFILIPTSYFMIRFILRMHK